MTKIKCLVQHRTLIFALILALFGLTNSPIKASSESAKPANNSSTSSRRIPFKRIPAPNRGIPHGTRQAAKRGEGCPIVALPLTTALVPIAKTASEEQVAWGLTSAEYPTFWFYVPYPPGTYSGELRVVIKDEKGGNIQKSLIGVTGTTPGVVGVRLPSTEAPLKIGELYTYKFAVSCKPGQPSENEYVVASVERRELSASLASQLRTATEREKAILYAQEGFWDEALTTLAELRRKNPNDAGLTADWDALLEEGGLNEIKQKPIVPLNQIQQEPSKQ